MACQLRSEALKTTSPGLQLLALTATATPSVRAGLRRAIFGLDDDAHDPADFAFVRADPLRTNLALWARDLNSRRTSDYANIVTSVAAAMDRHAIVYCLTVKDAVAVHNLLLTHFGEQERDRIRLYHGRLSDTIKASVANDFRNAPVYEDDPGDFRRLIVVATSAFGLGINRPDVRTVFCASPPTDISALYQQVGRAGRDARPAAGLMLLTARARRVLRFMTRRELDDAKLLRITAALLKPRPHLNTRTQAAELADEDFAAGRARLEDLERGLADQYHVAVVRVLAELAAAGLVTDLGDFPISLTILRGTRSADTDEYRSVVEATLAAAPGEQIKVVELHERLTADSPCNVDGSVLRRRPSPADAFRRRLPHRAAFRRASPQSGGRMRLPHLLGRRNAVSPHRHPTVTEPMSFGLTVQAAVEQVDGRGRWGVARVDVDVVRHVRGQPCW